MVMLPTRLPRAVDQRPLVDAQRAVQVESAPRRAKCARMSSPLASGPRRCSAFAHFALGGRRSTRAVARVWTSSCLLSMLARLSETS